MTKEDTDHLSARMKLHIHDIREADFGSYFCVAKNSLGRQDGKIKLSGKKEEMPRAQGCVALHLRCPLALCSHRAR